MQEEQTEGYRKSDLVKVNAWIRRHHKEWKVPSGMNHTKHNRDNKRRTEPQHSRQCIPSPPCLLQRSTNTLCHHRQQGYAKQDYEHLLFGEQP